MATVMTATEFVKKLEDVAKNYKTLYVMGCIGAPMTAANKKKYINHHKYNQSADRVAMIIAASADTFGFDCVCLFKSILWGWNGNKKGTYGGAKYKSNEVPDVSADGMIQKCYNVTTDFSKIEVGEVLWRKGHVGVYIGNGLAVECTPSWKNCVQITAVNVAKAGYNTRKWTKHGKLPYIEYESAPAKKSIDEIAREVIDGKWYTGAARKSALTKAGYNYAEVQARVNEIVRGNKKSIDEIAKEVIDGKWGVGADRKKRLTKAGYDAAAVQKRVNELMDRNTIRF